MGNEKTLLSVKVKSVEKTPGQVRAIFFHYQRLPPRDAEKIIRSVIGVDRHIDITLTQSDNFSLNCTADELNRILRTLADGTELKYTDIDSTQLIIRPSQTFDFDRKISDIVNEARGIIHENNLQKK